MLQDKTDRGVFVASLKEFLETWKVFDGVNVAFKPEKATDNTTMNVVKDLRKMASDLSAEHNKTYILAAEITNYLDIEAYNDIEKATDFALFPNYAFKGASLTHLGHHANLFAPAWNPEEKLTTNYLTKQLIAKGISPDKIVISVSTMGYGWTGVQNYTDGNPFTGEAKGAFNGSGRVIYKDIANEIAQGKWQLYDETAEAPYVFNNATGDLVTYEDVRSSKAKVKYVKDNQLAGVHVMHIAGDNGDLLNAVNEELGNDL